MQNLLKIDYDENLVYAECEDEDRREVFNRQYARHIRHLTGFNDVITGDVFYKNLVWKKEDNAFNRWSDSFFEKVPHWFQPVRDKNQKGFAIERDGKIIYFDMPGTTDNFIKRDVLFEKVKSYKIPKNLISNLSFQSINDVQAAQMIGRQIRR